jgi:hypothetical protein
MTAAIRDNEFATDAFGGGLETANISLDGWPALDGADCDQFVGRSTPTNTPVSHGPVSAIVAAAIGPAGAMA